MAFTAPPKASPGIPGMDFWALCEFAKLSKDQQERALGHKAESDRLAQERQSLRAEQTKLMEAERQLAERKDAVDKEWAALRVAKIEHDNAVVQFQARQKVVAEDAERNLNAAMARSAELDQREAGLNKRDEEIAESYRALDRHKMEQSASLAEHDKQLNAREAAVAAREKAAEELSAMLAKVRG